MAREMANLRRVNARLQQDIRDKDKALQQYEVTTELTLEIYRELAMDIPENARQRLAAAQAAEAIVSTYAQVILECI
ncbi:hypothetical protein HU200_013616 [Digitaria exilis]|uniref:Uncharacterized protein n=1 Tax=Digitaria exilis TaxID=1010633 RepID=A0A835FCE4_9POAL|nr:hypothetical protein HU200_013616 [Digitaria exilis]